MFYVVESFNSGYLTNRKSTGEMYVSRSSWSDDLDDAKVFSTLSAAKRSANENGEHGYWVHEVSLDIGNTVATVSKPE